ncbi:MAG TPA: STAS domain-containing protein [Acidimicrobiales bacterium]|nr:STAS domain-containing protein [Acidimicrobiales bacterium]
MAFAADIDDATISKTVRPLSISRALGRVVVTVHGSIEAEEASFLRQVLNDLIDGQGNLDIVVDCRHLTAIGHLGVAVLAEAGRRTAARRGRFALSGARDEVRIALLAFRPRTSVSV